MTRAVPPRLTFKRGFTLTELAVVLAIIALLIGSMMLPLAAQDDVRRTQETQKTLSDARDALVGFATAKGRLPCPATAASNGVEAPNGGGACTLFDAADIIPVGFLPAATLGLAPVDNQSRLLDGWGNPIRYGVTTSNTAAFTKSNGMSSTGMTALTPDLIICPTARSGGNNVQGAGTAAANCPTGVTPLTGNAVAVIYSLGPDAGRGGNGTDEQHNPNPAISSGVLASDRVFISHEPAPRDAPNGEFDDLVIWLSPNILYNRMIAAGRLP
jgi:prepilin-type N-terminal cleavage/methylation domain-containing protein